MEIRLNRGEFLTELNPMQGIVERKTTIPVLSHILLTARDDQGGVAQEGPGQGHPLPLPGGQIDAAELSGQHGVIALGQGLDGGVGPCAGGRLDDGRPVAHARRQADPDVLRRSERRVADEVLEDDGDVGSHRGGVAVGGIHAVLTENPSFPAARPDPKPL